MSHRHTHRRHGESRIVCWTRCVASGPCDGRTHGCVTYVATCRCGATRLAESNGNTIRYGVWTGADEDRDRGDCD